MVSIYYATVMVLTTGATILGVIVLRIHHQGRRGLPVTCKKNTGLRNIICNNTILNLILI